MKRALLILTLIAATALFFACGNKTEESDADVDSTEVTTDETGQTIEYEVDGEEVKVEVNKDGYKAVTEDGTVEYDGDKVVVKTKDGTVTMDRKGATKIEKKGGDK